MIGGEVRTKGETGAGGLGFPWVLEKYLHIPRPPSALPPSSPSPISAARFFDIGSGVSIFRSFASRSDFHSLRFFLYSPSYPFPFFPSHVLYLCSRADVFLSFSLSLSFSLPFPLSRDHLPFISRCLFLSFTFSLSLFFPLARCASENMNPSPHCLRQRFSNFPPLCANDEGTKREIKSRPQ